MSDKFRLTQTITKGKVESRNMDLVLGYNDLLKKLSSRGESGVKAAQAFTDACLALYEARATRLPKMLKGEPHAGIADAHSKLREVAKHILEDHPELTDNRILQNAAFDTDHELIRQMLTEVMWQAR